VCSSAAVAAWPSAEHGIELQGITPPKGLAHVLQDVWECSIPLLEVTLRLSCIHTIPAEHKVWQSDDSGNSVILYCLVKEVMTAGIQ
jgi:hypothetical protein